MSDVRPRDVPGFAEAATAGLLPVVPPTPPPLLPGPTAERLFRVFLVRLAIGIGAMLMVFSVMPRAGVSSPWTDLVVLGSGLLVLGLAVRWWLRIGRRNVQELQHGYTTVTLQFGGFGWSDGRRREGHSRLTAWDYSGIWVLHGRTGQVVSAPDSRTDPPGFYPSPDRHPEFELWSGSAWAGRYRHPWEIDASRDRGPRL